ncbi:hypothetical protein MH215_04970 [Paenibacillus sp. ACRSA]|uniref:hypothetical protein n=1 Tax=Paenibacillus sp. ACRSA TaxID=2918211 RepID=UPI001EF6C2A0|nr:hypothetical protein [Paenibacillus sp. ACRSA]MCG7376334.1 hypothetical protein [Paenibacillus sp. ACRSA]
MIKRYWIFIAILIPILVIVYYEHRLNEAKANEDVLMELYQSKNNSGYITLLKDGHSFKPLAQTLEELSQVTNQVPPAKVQKLLDQAKVQAKDATQYLTTLIEFSDNYISTSKPRYMIEYDHSVMTSAKQKEVYQLAYGSGLYGLMYGISHHYWKDKPKLIPQATQTALASIAKELRALDKTLASYKTSTDHQLQWGDERSMEQLKSIILNEMRPHFEKIVEFKDEINF